MMIVKCCIVIKMINSLQNFNVIDHSKLLRINNCYVVKTVINRRINTHFLKNQVIISFNALIVHNPRKRGKKFMRTISNYYESL